MADVVGCDHKTVKAHIERQHGDTRPATRRATLADAYREMLTAKLEVTKGRITAKALFRTVVAAGYTGSARTLRRAVAELKAAYTVSHSASRPKSSLTLPTIDAAARRR